MSDTTFQYKQTSITSAWLQDVNNHVYKETVNVKHFGAKGDGVTDDTIPIQNAINAGIRIAFDDGTSPVYKVSAGSLTVSKNGTILDFGSASLNCYNGDTNFTLKLTGNFITALNLNITIPNNPQIAGSGSAPLQKAIVWNQGKDNLLIKPQITNVATYGIFNDGGDRLVIFDPHIVGNFTSYTLSMGNNHFAYYQDGSMDVLIKGGYISTCVMGVGAGSFNYTIGSIEVDGTKFDSLGQHPAYIANGFDGSMIHHTKSKNCGSSFALIGERFIVTNNQIHVDCSLYSGEQSVLGMRNSKHCIVKNNVFTGRASSVILAFENVLSGTEISDNIVEDNIIAMDYTNSNYSSGAACASYAIRIGSENVTTLNRNNRVRGNVVDCPISTSFYQAGSIYFTASASNQVLEWEASNNTILANQPCAGVHVKYGARGIQNNNKVIATNWSYTANLTAFNLDTTHDTDSWHNQVIVRSPTGPIGTVTGFIENGNNTTTYMNKFASEKIYSDITGTNLQGFSLIAGSRSQVRDLQTSETLPASTGTNIKVHHGTDLRFTCNGAARFLDVASGEVFPDKYEMIVHNDDPTYIITFDYANGAAGHLQANINPGKTAMFNYDANNAKWRGGQID